MSSTATNSAILAAAGSRKTEYVVDSALTVNGGRVLITTYTNENQRQIIQRIEQKVGFMPSNISVVGRKRSVKDTPRTGIDYAEASLSGLPRFQGNKAS
jgi:hypothetical protein